MATATELGNDPQTITRFLVTASRTELVELCKRKHLSKSGSKTKLARRILEAYSIVEVVQTALVADRLQWWAAPFLRALLSGPKTKNEILDHEDVKDVLAAVAADKETPDYYKIWLPEKFLRWNKKHLVDRDIVALRGRGRKWRYEIRPEFHEHVKSVVHGLTLDDALEKYRLSEDYQFFQRTREHPLLGFRGPRNLLIGASDPQHVDEEASIRRIVAFSDYRVQDIELLLEFVRSLDPVPDLILYGGDDIDRFGRLPDRAINGFLNKTRQTKIWGLEQLASSVYSFVLPAHLKDRASILEEIARKVGSHTIVSKSLNENLARALNENKTDDEILSVALQTLKEGHCIISNDSKIALQRARETATSGPFTLVIDTDGFVGEVMLWKRLGEEPYALTHSKWLSFASELTGADPTNLSQVIEFLERRSYTVSDVNEQSGTVNVVLYLPRQTRNFFEQLASLTRHGLCGVIGNDDDPAVRSIVSGEKVFNVHTAPVVLGNYVVIGLEGACIKPGEPNPGIVLYGEDDVSTHLRTFLVSDMPDKRIIIVSHTPPYETLDHALRFGERNIGSVQLRRFVETNPNVSLVVSGHVHYCGGKTAPVRNSIVVNAASHDYPGDPGRVAIIDIDVDGGTQVTWHIIHELTGIFQIGDKTAERLRNAGVRKPEDLYAANLETLSTTTGLRPKTLARLAIRARAVVEGRVFKLSNFNSPASPRIYMDIETDLNQDVVWLIGVYSESRDLFQSFFAEGPLDEKRILQELISFVGKANDTRICSFSGSKFEERVLRKRLIANELPTELVGRIIDLCPEVRRSLALPLKSYKLKFLADYFEYSYKHRNMDGWDVAMMYFGEYQTNKDPSVRQTLLEYNRDDVMFLPHLIEKVSSLS